MITLKDCLDFSVLSEAEIGAIAQHAHEPILLSVAHAEYLSQSADGKHRIAAYLTDTQTYAPQASNLAANKNLTQHHKTALQHKK